MSSSADIIVVGCGVAGATAAETAASLGPRVLILEEHDRVGIPSHCSGHVGIKSMRRLGIQPPEKIIKNQIRGATFHSPSGQTLRLERRTPITRVLDRRAFDEHLANRASKAGAEILLNCRALSMRTTEPTTVEVRVSSKEKPGMIRGNVVVAMFGAPHRDFRRRALRDTPENASSQFISTSRTNSRWYGSIVNVLPRTYQKPPNQG